MLSLQSVLVFATLLLQCLATPNRASSKKSFTVPRTLNKAFALDGPAVKRKIFAKFGWDLPLAPTLQHGPLQAVPKAIPEAISRVVSKAYPTGPAKQHGKVSATPTYEHAAYLSSVNIGGQTLSLDFDTGSSDLWVFSTYLPASEVSGQTLFNPNASSTFKNATGETWAISYGDGSGAAGLVGYDTVDIGGATVTSQAVELATAVSQHFSTDVASDGILGLGFSRLNEVQPDRQKTWFQNIKHQLDAPIFTADLNEDGSGFYQFGGADRSSIKEHFTKIPVDPSKGFWQFESSSFTVGGKAMVNKKPSPAIADTGTSILIVDTNVASSYYAAVKHAQYSYMYGGWVYPCSEARRIPDFGVSMGLNNFTVNIPARLLTYGPVGNGTCFGGVQDNNGFDMQVYGDMLFRSTYVVFEDYRHVAGSNHFLGLSVGKKAK